MTVNISIMISTIPQYRYDTCARRAHVSITNIQDGPEK